jgi:hypothetical protein
MKSFELMEKIAKEYTDNEIDEIVLLRKLNDIRLALNTEIFEERILTIKEANDNS